jgi:hypothetical protein
MAANKTPKDADKAASEIAAAAVEAVEPAETPEPADLPDIDDEETMFVDSMTATFSAIGTVEADELRANGSAIGSARAETFTATASAIGLANVDGDAHITVSAVPIVRTTGGATFSQAYASAVIVGGEMNVHQAATPVMISKSFDATQVLTCAVVTGEADIKRSTVGLLLTREANISEDSRVLLTTKGALIIAAALLGGFGFVAIAMVLSARRISQWRPQVTLPNIAEIREQIKHLNLQSLPWRRSA